MSDAPVPFTAAAATSDALAMEALLPSPLRADSTLLTAIDAFNEYMVRKGFSDNTIKAFRNDLKIFVSFMEPGTRLMQVQPQHLEAYLEWMRTERVDGDQLIFKNPWGHNDTNPVKAADFTKLFSSVYTDQVPKPDEEMPENPGNDVY